VNASSERFVEELAAEEGVTLRIRGGCMTPHLVEGSNVMVRARRLYLPGDVVVFRTPAGDLAAHRVLGWRPAGLVTKGDGCTIHDAPVPRAAIVGAAAIAVPFSARLRAVVELGRIVIRRITVTAGSRNKRV
jgi:hypothetical protein